MCVCSAIHFPSILCFCPDPHPFPTPRQNTIIILTSNLGAEFLQAAATATASASAAPKGNKKAKKTGGDESNGAGSGEEEDGPASTAAETESPGIAPEVRAQVMATVRRHFRPEFLNRLDDIVIFQPLSKAQLRSIMRLQMGAIAQRLKDRNIGIELTDAGVQYVMDHAYDPLYGARPIRRFLEKAVTTHVSRMLIGGELDRDQTLKIDASEDGSQLAFRVAPRPSALSASGGAGGAAAEMEVDADDNPAPSFFRLSPGRGK